MQDPILFTLTVLAILGTPGPTNTLLASSGALVGVRRSLVLIGAELAGYTLAIASLHVVLGTLLGAYPEIKTALRLLVGAYLLVTAHALWSRRDEPMGHDRPIGFNRVFVTTLLNPKAIVFAFGVLPLSQPDAAAYAGALLAMIVVVASAWILLGTLVGRMASTAASRVVPRVSAAVLTCFAGLIAVGG